MSGHFTRILVPTDFGAASEAALECAKELARRFEGRLYLLHVVEDPMAQGVWTPEVYVGASAELRETLLRDAKQRADQALTAAEREELEATIEIRVGAAADTIGECAREMGIELIVMGTHGRRGLAHMFLGSVAERMVRTAPCPVLTVREHRARERSVTSAQLVGHEPAG